MLLMTLLIVGSTVVTLYAVSSFIFLRKPHWLHRIRRPSFLARNIAHRGGAAESIENSLLAFDTALSNGAEMLEMDCHLTKDKKPVVFHDFSLERVTGQFGNIRDLDYNELPSLRSSIELYYDPETIISSEINQNNQDLLQFPLLQRVFERYPTIPINLDVKENNDELIRQVSDLIEQYHREDFTYWGSFSHAVCRKLTIHNRRIVRFCSLKEAIYIVVAYWLGLLPFIPLTAGAFEVPIPGEVFRKQARRLNWKYKTLFYLAERALNNKTMFTHLQRRGIPVYVWILNNEQEFDYAFNDMGVTGVMTDYPTRLQSYLTSNPHRSSLIETMPLKN